MMNERVVAGGFNGKPAIIFPGPVNITCEADADIILTCICAARLRDGAEVKMFGLFDEEEYEISEIVIPRQRCSSGMTQSNEKELSLLWRSLSDDGKDVRLYNSWIHSHVRGSTYFSPIDDAMVRQHLKVMLFEKTTEFLAEDENRQLPDFFVVGPFISIVANVYGKMTLRVDFFCRSEIWEKPVQAIFYPSLRRPFTCLSGEEQQFIFETRLPLIKEKVETMVERVPE